MGGSVVVSGELVAHPRLRWHDVENPRATRARGPGWGLNSPFDPTPARQAPACRCVRRRWLPIPGPPGWLAAGAAGVLHRASEPAALLAGLARAHQHPPVIDPAITTATLTPDDHHLGGLSARQIQILALLAEGYPNADAAAMLGVSTETVRTHVRVILRKLAARDRTHAVARAYHHGLLPPRHAPHNQPPRAENPALETPAP